jgi:hypothetical protein
MPDTPSRRGRPPTRGARSISLFHISFGDVVTRFRQRASQAAFLTLAALLVIGAQALAETDPLPSWNDGATKAAIVAFVGVTTDKSSPHFVPPEERIATFDNDGTLWPSHPMYTSYRHKVTF